MHIQIVLNIALRLARLLFRRGVVPSIVADHGLKERDAEVVIAAGALFHCVGMSIHRTDHETFSLFLTADKLPRLLDGHLRASPSARSIVAEALHAIISHRRRGDAVHGRGRRSSASPTRSTWPAGAHACRSRPADTNIHSLSAYAIEEVQHRARAPTRRCGSRSSMSNTAGIFQVDELLATKLRGTPLEEHIEVVARIEAEHEERLIEVFRV